MKYTEEQIKIPDVLEIHMEDHLDERGWFFELYRESFRSAHFIQSNISFSHKGVLRGLHFQNPHSQGKLVQVLSGSIYDVVVDLRVFSCTFGKWIGFYLSRSINIGLWIPPGCAHGFYAFNDAMVLYNLTDYYFPEHENTLLWSDPDVGINWPTFVDPPLIISKKDKQGKTLKELIEQNKIFK